MEVISGEDEKSIAEMTAIFKALGDKTRLRIIQFLRAAQNASSGEANGAATHKLGPTVGAVCSYLTGDDKISSVISFHLKELRQAGLIEMERHGRNINCTINMEAFERVADYVGASPILDVVDALLK